MKIHTRSAVWLAILGIAGGALWWIWTAFKPLENHPVIGRWWMDRNLSLLPSKNARSATRAWEELRRLYSIKWSAYDRLVWQVKTDSWKTDNPPIYFQVVPSGSQYAARPGPPEEGCCRTVNEALMAILHQEDTRRTRYSGNWNRWWEENQAAFPNRVLTAQPSGPEAPSKRK